MANLEIRMAILQKRLKHYQVAKKIGISTYTFSHWLQNELPQDKKDMILEVIEKYEF